MVLTLRPTDFLRLRGARGVAIEVLDGRVWITESGTPRDAILGPGRSYRVAGDGLVLVEPQARASGAPGAEICLRPVR